jgi:hypothetical protein
MTIGATNVSANIKSINAWLDVNSIGHFSVVLRNASGVYSGVFAPNNDVDIDINAGHVFNGLVDNVHPMVDQEPDIFTQNMEVLGRDYGRELVDLIVDKYYGVEEDSTSFWRALDIIDDMLAESASDITYTSPGTGTRMTYDAKDEFLLDAFRNILNERLNYDFYIDGAKALQAFAVSSLASGITLNSSVGGTNNILHFAWDENDGSNIKNYILLKGKKVEDGWSEFNAADYTVPTNGAAQDVGNIIKVAFGAAGYTGCVAGDIGKAVHDPWKTLGILKHYNNTTRTWWVNSALTVESGVTLHIDAGTGQGITNTASVDLPASTGVASIRFQTGSATEAYLALDIYNGGVGLYGRTYIDWSILDKGDLTFFVRQDDVDTYFQYYYVSLFDDGGNEIRFKFDESILGTSYIKDGKWYNYSCPIGASVSRFSTEETKGFWYSITGTTFTWKVRKIEIGAICYEPGTYVVNEFYLDGLTLPAMMQSIAQEPTSQSLYGLRQMVVSKPNIESQRELDLAAADLLLQKQDPVKFMRVWARGSAGNTAGTNNWKPGYTLTLNIPGEGITSQTWRMISIHHIYDADAPMFGHDYVCEVLLAPSTSRFDMRRYEALYNEMCFLRDLREYIRWLEQQEDAQVRFPTPTSPLGDLYLLSSKDWTDFWEAESSMITKPSGTAVYTDATAAGGYCIRRLSAAATADMWDFIDAVRPGADAVGTHYIYLRMKVASNVSPNTVLTLAVWDENASSNVTTCSLKPDMFRASDAWQFVSMRLDGVRGHEYKIRGNSFQTGITDVYLDWIGVSTLQIPFATTGITIELEADLDDGLLEQDLDDGLDDSDNDSTAAAGTHNHTYSSETGRLPTSIANRWCSTTSGGPTDSSFIAILAVTGITAFMTALNTGGEHTHGVTSPTHDHGVDSPVHDHGVDSPNHDHATDEDEGHVH